MEKEDFFSRDRAGNPKRARQHHLARSGSQSQRRIWFILPAHRAILIISQYKQKCLERNNNICLGRQRNSALQHKLLGYI